MDIIYQNIRVSNDASGKRAFSGYGNYMIRSWMLLEIQGALKYIYTALQSTCGLLEYQNTRCFDTKTAREGSGWPTKASRESEIETDYICQIGARHGCASDSTDCINAQNATT